LHPKNIRELIFFLLNLLATEHIKYKRRRRMDFDEFLKLCHQDKEPQYLDDTLVALWFESRGNWDQAHTIVQEIQGADAAWVHAYLHRKEGDDGNASYWYSRAGKNKPQLSFQQEWQMIIRELLEKDTTP
jgi:hypothetical protein